MKRFAIALTIIILLAILSSCFPILAQPTHIPHQNLAMSKDSPDPVALLLFYGNVFDLAVIRQYRDAQSMLDELKHANIPNELRYLIDRYSTLSRQLLTTLDDLELILDEASTLLAEDRVSEAKQKLDAANVAIDDAQLLLKDIETATNTLSDKLGIFAAVAGSQIRLAYDQLEEILHRLRQLTNELNQLWRSLAEKHKAQVQGKLMPTELTLSITPASVFVGDSITASGRLTCDGNPLAKRKLTFFLNNEPLVIDNEPLVITTDLDGSYTSNIAIPYKYVSTMTLSAVYTASGYGIDTYLGCKSPLAVVNTRFYPTFLEVSVSEAAHPGLPITISGQVSSTDGTVNRAIKVLLDDILCSKNNAQGRFSLQITSPPQLSTGKHSLTVIVTSQRRYSDALRSLTINISPQLPIQTDIQVPPLIVIPKPIQVSGRVYHSLDPIQDARISLKFRDSSTTVKTATDGSFTTTIEAPLDLSLAGPRELAITVEPVETWYTSLEIKRGIFIINPANIGLMLVAFISLGLLVFTRTRARPVRPREEVVFPELKLREPPAAAPPPRPKYEFIGIKGRILSAYLDGLETVERITSIPMVPHTTLREFLNAITPRLLTAIKPFTELTIVAEIALYSTHKLDENTAARAEQLAATIKEELHGGTS